MENKLKSLGLTALAAVIIFSMAGCSVDNDNGGKVNNKGKDNAKTFTVTFDSDGGSSVPNQTVTENGKATEPQGVTKADLGLDGWYKEQALTTKWDFGADTVTADITLYAKWIAKTLTGIAITTKPAKTAYEQLDTLDLAGLVVTASYSHGPDTPVSAYTADPANDAMLFTAGTAVPVTITYTEGGVTKTATFNITVTARPPTEGLAYEAIGSPATAYRVRKGTVTTGVVVIPDTHEGLPVTEIGALGENSNGAFQSTTITAVYIPDSVTTIGGYAFRSCTSLASATIGAGVTEIPTQTFQNCTGITSITIPASVTTVGMFAFGDWTSAQTINVPWTSGNKPSGWDDQWNMGEATIVYQQ